ncbi:MAG: hypothetical protein WDN49_11635 [Acetobacteraceae bacterium]
MVFVRNGWAEGKSINVGTYTGPQGEFIRRGVIPKFQSDFGCRVYQTEGVTLGQIAILRTQKANPTYSVMFMDDVGVPIAKEEDLITALPRDKMPNLAHVIPRFLLNDGFGAAFAVSVVAPYFNTQAVTSIDSWEQLWDPALQGTLHAHHAQADAERAASGRGNGACHRQVPPRCAIPGGPGLGRRWRR